MGDEEGRMREEGGCKITSTTTTLGKLWSYYPVKCNTVRTRNAKRGGRNKQTMKLERNLMLCSTSTERLEERGQGVVQPLGEIPRLLSWYEKGFKNEQIKFISSGK